MTSQRAQLWSLRSSEACAARSLRSSEAWAASKYGNRNQTAMYTRDDTPVALVDNKMIVNVTDWTAQNRRYPVSLWTFLTITLDILSDNVAFYYEKHVSPFVYCLFRYRPYGPAFRIGVPPWCLHYLVQVWLMTMFTSSIEFGTIPKLSLSQRPRCPRHRIL